MWEPIEADFRTLITRLPVFSWHWYDSIAIVRLLPTLGSSHALTSAIQAHVWSDLLRWYLGFQAWCGKLQISQEVRLAGLMKVQCAQVQVEEPRDVEPVAPPIPPSATTCGEWVIWSAWTRSCVTVLHWSPDAHSLASSAFRVRTASHSKSMLSYNR